jgi:hypothetical protein
VSESSRIQIPVAFVKRAQHHWATTGQPLLECSALPYSSVVYACAWSPPQYELQDQPGPHELESITWGDYASYYDIDLPELLAEYGLEEEELDNEVPESLRMDGAASSPGAGVYATFEELWASDRDVVGTYECAETGELLGEVRAFYGPAPGNDYIGVSIDNPIVLSCLQYHLNRMSTGVRIELGSTNG